MKTLKLLSVLFLFSLLFSCSKKDEMIVEKPILINTLSTWNLINATGGLFPQNINYSIGTIVLTFNTTSQSVNIVNTSSPNAFLPTGNYPCIITNNSNGTYCYNINNNFAIGCTILNSSELLLNPDAQTRDGMSFKLIQ